VHKEERRERIRSIYSQASASFPIIHVIVKLYVSSHSFYMLLDREVFVLGPGIFDMLDSKVRHTFGIPCALPVGRSIVVVSA